MRLPPGPERMNAERAKVLAVVIVGGYVLRVVEI